MRWMKVAVGVLVLPAAAAASQAAASDWLPAGNPASLRPEHPATPLPAGRVLVAGGEVDGTAASSAELYDPVTRSWSAAASMGSDRVEHSATLLANGKVLVAGGFSTTASARLSTS